MKVKITATYTVKPQVKAEIKGLQSLGERLQTALNREIDETVVSKLKEPARASKILRGEYVTDRIYIPAGSPFTGGAVAAAAGVAGGVHDTVKATEPRTTAEREQLSVALKTKETQELRTWATELGAMQDVSAFEKRWREQGNVQGSEQRVALNEGGRTVTKLKVLRPGETWLDYLQRLQAHEALFPATAYRLKGFADAMNLRGESVFSAVVEQPYVKGRAATQNEIDEHMSKMGFVKVIPPDLAKMTNNPDKFARYVDPDSGLTVYDLNGDNVIVTPGGNVAVVDPIIEMDPFTKKQRMLNEFLDMLDESDAEAKQ